VIFALFMTDFFDTVGTATAVTSSAGLVDKDGGVPQLKRLLLVDSGAAAAGGAMGVSSVTTYVESGAGVSEGARTGLASLVTAALFLLTIFFVPLIALVGQGVTVNKVELHPATAAALVMVGYLMIRLVGDIDWKRPEAAFPAYLTIIGIPMTFSIAAGIGLGVFGYVVAMVAQRRAREVHVLMWCLVPMFAAFYASNWLSDNVF
jgi:adenine/guanine/hypoxanthine permease